MRSAETRPGILLDTQGTTGATWGVLGKLKPGKRSYLMAAVYNGDPAIRAKKYHGVNLSLRGLLFTIGEVGYQVNGLPGRVIAKSLEMATGSDTLNLEILDKVRTSMGGSLGKLVDGALSHIPEPLVFDDTVRCLMRSANRSSLVMGLLGSGVGSTDPTGRIRAC